MTNQGEGSAGGLLDLPPEVRDGSPKALLQRDPRLPAQQRFRLGYVGTTLLRVVRGGQRLEDDLARTVRQAFDLLGEFYHCPLRRIPDVDRSGVVRIDEPPEAV